MENKTVLDFNQALRRSEEQDHDKTCPHCKFINAAVKAFVKNVTGKKIGSEAFIEEVKDLIGFIEESTRQNVMAQIGYSLLEQSGELDEDE